MRRGVIARRLRSSYRCSSKLFRWLDRTVRPRSTAATGTLQFDVPSDAMLPVKELLSFKYAHFHADLPYGKVLKTYTDVELGAIRPAAA